MQYINDFITSPCRFKIIDNRKVDKNGSDVQLFFKPKNFLGSTRNNATRSSDALDPYDKDVRFWILNPPSHDGHIQSLMSRFFKKYIEIIYLEHVYGNIEKNKATHPYYDQKVFPPFGDAQYEAFQNYTCV